MENDNSQQKQGSFGTHDGVFHADEIFACALLLHCGCIREDEIVRTRDEEKLKQCEYVCDVGGVCNAEEKQFDHHQVEGTGERASAGLVLEYLREEGYLSEEMSKYLDEHIIRGVDAHDVGRSLDQPGVCTISHCISLYNPSDYCASDQARDEAFFEALHLARNCIRKMCEKLSFSLQCRDSVKEAMASNQAYLHFKQPMPWMDNFFSLGGEEHPARFVVMQAGNHWKLRTIPPNLNQRMEMRQSLPHEWGGLSGKELEKVTGIEGSIFCHKGCFISIWETEQAALRALQHVLGLASGLEGINQKSDKTLFEKVIAGELPADCVHEDELFYAVKDIAPQAPIHILIFPKQVIPDVHSIRQYSLIGGMVRVAQQIADDMSIGEVGEGYRLVINYGKTGGQTVPHIHIHFLSGSPLGGFGVGGSPGGK